MMSFITPKEREAIKAFRKRLDERQKDEAEEEAEKEMITKFGGEEACLWRFLMARGFLIDRATEMFLATLQWRMENEVENAFKIFKDNFDLILPHWPGGFYEPTHEGNPFISIEISKLNLSSLLQFSEQQLTHFYIYWMEYSLKLQRESLSRLHPSTEDEPESQGGGSLDSQEFDGLQEDELSQLSRNPDGEPLEPEPAEEKRNPRMPGMIEIYDLRGLCRNHVAVKSLQQLMKVLKVGQDYYPEHLERAYVLHAPFLFSMAWRVVKGALHERTQAKVAVSSQGLGEEEAFGRRVVWE